MEKMNLVAVITIVLCCIYTCSCVDICDPANNKGLKYVQNYVFSRIHLWTSKQNRALCYKYGIWFLERQQIFIRSFNQRPNLYQEELWLVKLQLTPNIRLVDYVVYQPPDGVTVISLDGLAIYQLSDDLAYLYIRQNSGSASFIVEFSKQPTLKVTGRLTFTQDDGYGVFSLPNKMVYFVLQNNREYIQSVTLPDFKWEQLPYRGSGFDYLMFSGSDFQTTLTVPSKWYLSNGAGNLIVELDAQSGRFDRLRQKMFSGSFSTPWNRIDDPVTLQPLYLWVAFSNGTSYNMALVDLKSLEISTISAINMSAVQNSALQAANSMMGYTVSTCYSGRVSRLLVQGAPIHSNQAKDVRTLAIEDKTMIYNYSGDLVATDDGLVIVSYAFRGSTIYKFVNTPL